MVARLRVISKSQSMIFLISNTQRNGKISRELNYFEKIFPEHSNGDDILAEGSDARRSGWEWFVLRRGHNISSQTVRRNQHAKQVK